MLAFQQVSDAKPGKPVKFAAEAKLFAVQPVCSEFDRCSGFSGESGNEQGCPVLNGEPNRYPPRM